MASCTARLISPTLRLRISTMRGVSYSKRKPRTAPQHAAMAAALRRAGSGAAAPTCGPNTHAHTGQREPGFPCSAAAAARLVAERSGTAPVQCPPHRCPLAGRSARAGSAREPGSNSCPKERSGAGMGCAARLGGSPSAEVLGNRVRDVGGGAWRGLGLVGSS